MNDKIEKLRKKLDEVDGEIVRLLAERAHIAGRIGEIKEREGLPIYDEARWREIKKTRGDRGERYGCPREYIENVYEEIHRNSVTIQENRKG